DPRRGRGRCGRGVRGRFLVHGLSRVSAPTASWATPKTLGIVQQSRNTTIWLDSARKHVSRGGGAGMGPEWSEELARQRAGVARSSVAERVAATLRDRIIEGELPPGTRLSEESIGRALGVSRNTLREAFHLLGHERLVVHEFNRGVFVRSVDVADIRDLYRFRRLLEGAAIAAAAGSSPDLQGLRDATAEGERAWPALGSANMHFHRELGALAGSRRLDETMEQVLAEMRLVFSVMADPHAFHAPYLAENQKLLRLLEEERYEEARAALGHYLDIAEAQLLRAMDSLAG